MCSSQYVESDYKEPVDDTKILPQFYRGNIEANNDAPTPLLYYGAATPINKNEKLVLSNTFDDDDNVRESVETDPGRADIEKHEVEKQEKEFRNSRPFGHSLAYDQYKGKCSVFSYQV